MLSVTGRSLNISTEERRRSRSKLHENPTYYPHYCMLNKDGIVDHLTMLGHEEDPVKRLLPEFGNCSACMELGLLYTRCRTCSQLYKPTITKDLVLINPRLVAKAFFAKEDVPYKPTDKVIFDRKYLTETADAYDNGLPAILMMADSFDPILDLTRKFHELSELTPHMKMLRAIFHLDYREAHQIYQNHKDEIGGAEYYQKIHVALNPWGTYLPITEPECVVVLNKFFTSQKSGQDKEE